jgi:hypothetical protein
MPSPRSAAHASGYPRLRTEEGAAGRSARVLRRWIEAVIAVEKALEQLRCAGARAQQIVHNIHVVTELEAAGASSSQGR